MTPPATANAPARLLLVDDEESVLLTLTHILRNDGYEVTSAPTAARACELLRECEFDVIVTDMRMEDETSGLQVLAAARERDPQATGIILTGYASFPSAIESLQAGVSDYLAKPSNIEQLKLAVANALEKRRLAKAMIHAERAEAGRLAAERGREEAERARHEAEQAWAQAQRYAVEQARALEAVERHAARLAFLSAAGVELSGSLDTETVLARLARLAIPFLADWCVLDLVEGDAPEHFVQQVAVAHVDPGKEELAREVQRRAGVLSSPRQHALQQVLATGRSYHAPLIGQGELAQSAPDDGLLALLRQLTPRSILAVPLLSESRVLGVMSFLFSESDRQHEPDDVAACEDLGRRAGVTIEHRRLYQQRQAELDRMSEFLTAAAHDLRTPLTSIKGWVQLLRRDSHKLDGPLRARLERGTGAVEQATTRMVGLLNELLDVSRLDGTGQLELVTSPVDLVPLARRVVAEYRPLATSQHRLRLAARVRSLTGCWDEQRLERVLANLVSNAIKYSPDGGLLTVQLRQERNDGRGWAVIDVSDSGVGIPRDQIEQVFDRFQRGDNVRHRIPGTGIGLAYVRQIVLLHAGTLAVDSRPGQGSTFTVRLPL